MISGHSIQRVTPAFVRQAGTWALFLTIMFGWNSARGQVTEPITIEAPDTKFNIENCRDESFSFSVTFSDTTSIGYADGALYYIYIGRGNGCEDTESDPRNMKEIKCYGSPDKCCEKLESGTLSWSLDVDVEKTINTDSYPILEYFNCDLGLTGEVELTVYAQPGYSMVANTLYPGTYTREEDDDWTEAKKNITIDLKRPDPPASLDSVVAGESVLKISWTPLEDETLRYRAYAYSSQTVPFDRTLPIEGQDKSPLYRSSITSAGEGSTEISDLLGETWYQVAVVSIDEADNESLPSESLVVQTTPVLDFYQYYAYHGGSEPGGYCGVATVASATEQQLLLPFILVGLVLGLGRLARGRIGRLRKLVRRVPGLVLVVSLSLLPLRAAQAESPRILTFALSWGTYIPDIDKEFHSSVDQGPYRSFFGEDGPTITRLDLGWNLLNGYGTLTAGLTAGYGSHSANGFATTGSGTTLIPQEKRAPESSKLVLVPLAVNVLYAFDWPAERFSFPLVPFVSGGLDYVFWWIYDGSDSVATTDAGNGKGGIYGFHGSLGCRLLLDVFAPDMATAFDLDMGVNSSYLYVEYLLTSLNNFGERGRFNLSARTVFFGFAFDF